MRQYFPGQFDSAYFEAGPLKEPERALKKINGDYNGDTSRITDLVRGRIIVDNPEQIALFRDYVSQDYLSFESYKDRFAKPSDTHFRDINTTIRLDNGHVAEFRVEHTEGLEPAKITHPLYEQKQEIERRAEMEGRPMTMAEEARHQALTDQIRDIHDQGFRETGVDGLLNEEGRARLEENYRERMTRDPGFRPPGEIMGDGHTADVVTPVDDALEASAGIDAGRHITTTGAEAAADAAKHADVVADAARGFHGGFIAEAGLGLAAGVGVYAFTDASLSDSGQIAFQVAVPYGEVATELSAGDTRGAVKAAMTETAGIGGALAGAAGGAIAGAAAGSIVPVVGTAIGGVAGGIIGGIAGGVGLGMGTDYLLTEVPEIVEGVHDGLYATTAFIGEAGSTIAATTDDLAAAAQEGLAGIREDFTSAASRGWDRVAALFGRDEPDIDPDELRRKLARIPPEEAEALSPETHALAIYSRMDDPGHFREAYEALSESQSLEHVAEDMARVDNILADQRQPAMAAADGPAGNPATPRPM